MLTENEKLILNEGHTEMSESEVEFLFGLLDKKRPQKLVEVGVAAGGTTAAIIEHLSKAEYLCKMYSIDKSEVHYRDTAKETGYYAAEYKNKMKTQIEHKFLFGKYAVEHLEKIGRGGIDFLILDTVHSLPGEILDFIGFLPYLSNHAVVVLHDTCLNHISGNVTGFATQLLLDVVSGKKIFDMSVDEGIPNIGAFIIDDTTRQNIDDVFRSLFVTWRYMIDDAQLSIYREFYRKHYSVEMMEIFEKAVTLNKSTYSKCKKNNRENIKEIASFFDSVRDKNIYIYGHGVFGKKIFKILEESGKCVQGFIISDDRQVTESDAIKIETISEFIKHMTDEDVIVLGVGSKHIKEIENNVLKLGVRQYVKIPMYIMENM
jgi:predicted O-methyltransferase YrrM